MRFGKCSAEFERCSRFDFDILRQHGRVFSFELTEERSSVLKRHYENYMTSSRGMFGNNSFTCM